MYFKWKLFAFKLNIIFMFLNHNSCISNGRYLRFIEILFNVYDRNSCISKILYLYFN